jgi:hypothetical protein
LAARRGVFAAEMLAVTIIDLQVILTMIARGDIYGFRKYTSRAAFPSLIEYLAESRHSMYISVT